MLNDLLQQFLNSDHGNDALQTLQQQHGLPPDQAQAALSAATAGAHDELSQQMGGGDPNAQAAGVMSNWGNAGIGGLASIFAGQGVGGAVKGAVGGAVAGRVAQEVARRTGMNPSTASTVAAAVTPFLFKFLHDRTAGGTQPPMMGGAPNAGFPQNTPPMGGMPGGKPAMAPGAKTPVGQSDGASQGQPTGEAKPPWKRLL